MRCLQCTFRIAYTRNAEDTEDWHLDLPRLVCIHLCLGDGLGAQGPPSRLDVAPELPSTGRGRCGPGIAQSVGVHHRCAGWLW